MRGGSFAPYKHKVSQNSFHWKIEELKSNTCPFWSMLMRKRFLCFHPGNGCISTAAAAIYHYANVARALIFGYCLYMLKAYCGTSPFHPGLLGLLFAEKEDLKVNKVLPTVFENFCFAEGQDFFFWETQTRCDFLVQTARTNKVSCLIVTQRIHTATHVLAWCSFTQVMCYLK